MDLKCLTKNWHKLAFWIGVAGLSVVVIDYLWTEHRAHLLGAIPFLLLALCPLFHMFGHRGHNKDYGHEP